MNYSITTVVLVTILTIFILPASTTAETQKLYTKCELAVELYTRFNFTMDTLPDWVCLAQSESSMKAWVKGGPNSNGSYDWGLFQINENYWCIPGRIGNDCNMDCNKLIDDDIADDVACVKMIYARHGYEAWKGWIKKCQGTLPSVSECFKN